MVVHRRPRLHPSVLMYVVTLPCYLDIWMTRDRLERWRRASATYLTPVEMDVIQAKYQLLDDDELSEDYREITCMQCLVEEST
jgi:hypothetical protein